MKFPTLRLAVECNQGVLRGAGEIGGAEQREKGGGVKGYTEVRYGAGE